MAAPLRLLPLSGSSRPHRVFARGDARVADVPPIPACGMTATDVVLDGSRVAQVGPHEELIARAGRSSAVPQWPGLGVRRHRRVPGMRRTGPGLSHDGDE